jgi:hypothetical protein
MPSAGRLSDIPEVGWSSVAQNGMDGVGHVQPWTCGQWSNCGRV